MKRDLVIRFEVDTELELPSLRMALDRITQELEPALQGSVCKLTLLDERASTYTYLDASTSSIDITDEELLEREPPPVIVHRYEAGYWVFVDRDALDSDFQQQTSYLRSLGFSDGFIGVLKVAYETGSWWIKYDRDGAALL